MLFHSVLAAIPTLTWPHVLLRLSVAAVLGGAIGMERELRGIEASRVVAGVGEIDGVLEVRWTE